MFKRVGVSALIVGCFLGVFADFSIASEGDAFHFDVGISYTNGANNVQKAVKNGYEDSGFSYSSVVIPVGLRLDPFYEFGFGLGIGAGIGPTQFGLVDNNGSYSDYYVIIPAGLDLRYEFINSANVDPYVRVGGRYPITIGSLVSAPRPGLYAGIGVEFPTLDFGLEVSTDLSTVQAGYNGITRRVMPNEIEAAIFFHF